MKPEDIASVEKRLGYTFKNKDVLVRALTRKAFAQEHRQQGWNCEEQEVYCVLGDAVLKAILVELLIKKGYDSSEAITNKKIEIENRKSLGAKLQELKIAPFIRCGLGEQRQGIYNNLSVLGETFEALIAAVHIDAGSYEATKMVVAKLFNDQIFGSSTQAVSPKTAQDSELDIMAKLWMQYNVCIACTYPEICAKSGICYSTLR